MQDSLQACVDNFGTAPRELPLWDRLTYLRVPKPLWLRFDPFDKLRTLHRNQRALLADGTIVWGRIVQANYLMFDKGNDSCPGELLYSLDAGNRVDHEYLLAYLEQVSFELSSFKDTKPRNRELFRIAEYLTDELIRVFGLAVPALLSSAIRCQMSTTLLVRKHLPDRQLCALTLPVIVSRQKPHVAIPLPERYWPEDLVRWWSQPSVPFDKALAKFSGHNEVRRLEQICQEAQIAINTHVEKADIENAAFYRDRRIKAALELQPLLEQLWHNEHN